MFSDMENIFQLIESTGLTENIMIASFPDWVFISQLLIFSELMKDHFVYKLVNFNLALVTLTYFNPGRIQDGCVFGCMIKFMVHMTVWHLKIICFYSISLTKLLT